MTTSNSSEAFQEEEKTESQLAAEKIKFPPKPDIQTDISNYRVASLLKMYDYKTKVGCKIFGNET